MFPALEGHVARITQDPQGLWHCDVCDFASPHHQAVVGHLGSHATFRGKRGRPKNRTIDPMDLSITELIARLEELEAANAKLRGQLLNERKRTAAVRSVMASFMSADKEEDS